jgi:hypothetical protein
MIVIQTHKMKTIYDAKQLTINVICEFSNELMTNSNFATATDH